MATTTGNAAFSACRRYRWWLERCWDPAGPRLLFIGLNPSRAGADHDDPTLRRLQGFARRWGYGSLEVLNLFAWISSSPVQLRRCSDPVGSANNHWLRQRLIPRLSPQLSPRLSLCRAGGSPPSPLPLHPPPPQPSPPPSRSIWLGWGNGGCWRDRDREVLGLIARCTPSSTPLLALALTAAGQPRHPLYAPADARPQMLQHPWGVIDAAPLP